MLRLRQYVKTYFCRRCFGCCRFRQKESIWIPHLLKEELISLKRERFFLKFINGQFVCSFLNYEDNLCRIYQIRPFECRLYPFLIHRIEDKLFLAVHLNCPFVKRENFSQRFKDYLSYLKYFLKKPKNLKIIIKNKDSFSRYPSEEIKILEFIDA